MRVTLFDWPYATSTIESWVRGQLEAIGLDPEGVDSAQVWSSVVVDAATERIVEIEHDSHNGEESTHTHEIPEWDTLYVSGAIVEHADPRTGIRTNLVGCGLCGNLTDTLVCPCCGQRADTEEWVAQTAEEIEQYLQYNSPGMVVQFRCDTCSGFYSVAGAVEHAKNSGHTEFHRA